MRDHADDAVRADDVEGVVEGRAGRLRREAMAPARAVEEPADLQARPALRVPEPGSPDHVARRLLGERPLSIAAELPVADEQRHRPPDGRAAERPPVAEVAHHLCVGVHRCEAIEVRLRERAEHEALRLDGRDRHRLRRISAHCRTASSAFARSSASPSLLIGCGITAKGHSGGRHERFLGAWPAHRQPPAIVRPGRPRPQGRGTRNRRPPAGRCCYCPS